MELNAKIYVAGHRGMVGSAVVRRLQAAGYQNIVARTSKELDLRNTEAVNAFFAQEKPDYVILAAAKVGGIMANNVFRADFLYENLQIQNNVIHASCIYPKLAPQPIKEEYLLTGPLESTNEPYALAKIAGLKLCEAYRDQHGSNFISAMPTNLYGPGDNYDLHNSHVLPALLRKFHEAKESQAPEVEVWGTGTPRREFLHVDDLADACLHLMLHYDGKEPVNVGTGEDLTIRELVELVRDTVGYTGNVHFNTDKPDGTPRKLLDVSKLAQAGWRYKTALPEGIRAVYREAFQPAALA